MIKGITSSLEIKDYQQFKRSYDLFLSHRQSDISDRRQMFFPKSQLKRLMLHYDN